MYELDHRSIRFSNGKRYQFPGEIAEIIDCEEAIVVRLESNSLGPSENVFGLDYSGNFLWQIPKASSFQAIHPYVSLSRKGGYVDVLNWDGHILTVNPKSGIALQENFYQGGPVSNRRAPSVRRWI